MQSPGEPRGTGTREKCPSSMHLNRLVEPDGPFARCRKLPYGSAQRRAGAGWLRWGGCGAAQPCGDQPEWGCAREERLAEGKLQEQFSSTQEAAAQRKDIVCSPYPLGTGQSLKLQGGRSQLDIKKTHPHSTMKPGACLGALGHPWESSEDPNGNRIPRSAHQGSRLLGPHILFPGAIRGAELGPHLPSSGPGCLLHYVYCP